MECPYIEGTLLAEEKDICILRRKSTDTTVFFQYDLPEPKIIAVFDCSLISFNVMAVNGLRWWAR